MDALEVQPDVRVEHLAGVVVAGVVDHDHRVRLVRLGGQAVEGPAEQVGPVVGDDDDGDGLAHARNLRWPEKSPRRAARQASTLSRIRAGSRRVNV